MSLDDATWAEVARLWCEGAEPAGVIAAKFGLSRQKLVAEARSRQWPARAEAPERRKAAAGRNAAAKPNAPAARERVREPARGGKKPAATAAAGKPPPAGAPGLATRPAAGRRGGRIGRRAMVERLFEAMDVKLTRIERHMAENGDASPAESERTARSLNSLVRSLEKLSAVEQRLGKAQKDRGETRRQEGGGDTTERRREELARRIAKLLERR